MITTGIAVTFIIGCYTVYAHDSLQQLHVVFRHGDRNPDLVSLYPNDPNLNDTWAPDGFGELTMHGKMKEYKIGKELRRRYDKFLGRIYNTEVIEPVSTNVNRTKMSLELVLAGLYPPAPSQVWNVLLPWQPIPYNYLSVYDPLMRDAVEYCEKYIELYRQSEKTEYFQNFLETNAALIQYINEHSGLNATTIGNISNLYFGLYAEVQTGRQIPKWTDKVYPDFLHRAAVLNYELQLYTDELIKLSGGFMLKKIITDLLAKKNGTFTPKGRKIFLYSGHEFNVAYILGALKSFKPHVPPYGSYVVVELHKINNVYGVKILHQDYTHKTPQYLAIPGCDIFCPLDQFIDLTEIHIPQDGDHC